MTQMQILEKAVHLDLLGKKVVNKFGEKGLVLAVHYDMLGDVYLSIRMGMRLDHPHGVIRHTTLAEWTEVKTETTGMSY